MWSKYQFYDWWPHVSKFHIIYLVLLGPHPCNKSISLHGHTGQQVDDMIAMVKPAGQEEVELLQGERTASGPDSRFVLSGGKSELRGARPKNSPVFFLSWGHSHFCVRDQFRWVSVVSNYLIFGGRILQCSPDWTQTHDTSASTCLELRFQWHQVWP